MKNNKRGVSFYTTDFKGSLMFLDLLKVDLDAKVVENIQDLKPWDGFGVMEIRLSRKAFNAKLKSYQKRGFEILEIDGASERLSKKTVLEALNVAYPKEKMYEFTHSRAEVFECYDMALIERVITKYLNGEMTDLLLNYWATFYSFCLEESYHVLPVSKFCQVHIESVTELFKQFAVVLSVSMTQEEKKAKVQQTLELLKQADSLYLAQEAKRASLKKKREERKNRKKLLTQNLKKA